MTEGHLLFVWTPKGYELREREGDAPVPGDAVDEDGRLLHVAKVGPSPLPDDPRPCAYLQG